MEKFHSILKRKFHILIFALTIISITAALLCTKASITTYADAMTEQEPAGQPTDGLGTGISYRHTGWLFYLVNPDGTEASDVRAIESYDYGITTETGEPIANSSMALITINGTKFKNYGSIETNAPWGPPFDEDANFRGNEVQQWLKSDPDGDGHTQAADIIAEQWGESAALKWESKEVYLVFEPFYWGRLIKNGETTGYWWCGTAPRWGIIQHLFHIDPIGDEGDPITRKYTNNVFPNCVTLEDCPEIQAMGLNAPTHGGKLSNTEMYTGNGLARNVEGYGIGIVWNEGFQTTADEPLQPTPHSAPNESTGTTTIIKSYRTRNAETNELTDNGTYTRTNVFNQILIENETAYQVVAWKTSTTLNASISSLTWESSIPGTIGNSGTTADAVDLTGTQKYLYVLLEKITTPPPAAPDPWDFQLKESQITKRVTFLEGTGPANTPSLINHNFKWKASAPTTTSCIAHGGNGHNLNCDTEWDEEPQKASGKKGTKGYVEATPGVKHSHGDSCYDTPCTSWKWTDNATTVNTITDSNK